MKVASFNVNSLRVRLPIISEWLKENQPDVLCVQETKVQDSDFPTDECLETGYHCVFRGEKSYNGVAVFSKTEMTDVKFGLNHEAVDETRLVKVKVNGVNIVNTYIPQGFFVESDNFKYKLQWFERLREFFERNFKPTDPVIWCGDMNVALDERDVHSPNLKLNHVCFHPDARKAFQNVAEWGFVDTFRMFNDQPGQYTFWDYRQKGNLEKNRGWRIDHIMVTKPLAEKCVSCTIDRGPRMLPRPSDHTPIVAELDI